MTNTNFPDEVFWQKILSQRDILMVQAMEIVHEQQDDAEDLVQDTLIKGYNQRDGFTAGSSFDSWLSTMMRNIYFSPWSPWRAHRSNKLYYQFQNMLLNCSRDTFIEFYNKIPQDFEIVLYRVLKLPDTQCATLLMYHFGCYEFDTIAKECRLSDATVKHQINRAINSVASKLVSGDVVTCDINLHLQEKIVLARANKQTLLVKTFEQLLYS